MVWGWFWELIGDRFIERSVTTEVYLDMLKEHLLPGVYNIRDSIGGPL